MKHVKLTFLLTILISMVGAKAYAGYAYDIAVQNADGVTIYYKYINDATELEVTFEGRYDNTNEIFNHYKGNIVIPDEVTYMNRTRKVTSIGTYAFYNSYGLTSITIPNSVTTIGSYAFYNSYGLTSITIPNSVTTIGESAFEDCTGLTSVTIGNSVTSIERSAFKGCNKLEKVIVSDIAAWCSIKFEYYQDSNPLCYAHHLYSDENTEIKDLIIPNSVTSIGNYAFYKCSGLTSVTIPNSVTTIGNLAFDECTGLTSVIIPNSVTSIGNYAFSFCTGLTSVTIPNSVTSIGSYAFEYCTGLTSVIIPNSVTTIGSEAFYCCRGLTSVTIGSGVTRIGERAFSEVDIPTIISLIENPFKIYGKSSNNYYRIFSLNTFNNATLYVPKGTIDKYKATDGWKDFAFIEEGTGGGETPPTPQTCEKPTIGYQEGKLIFTCATDGATCYYSITDSDIKAGNENEVQLTATYNISVFAAKTGCQNSETATATLCWIDVAPKTEGITNGVAEIPANAVLIQTVGGAINVQGVDDGTQIQVYSINGTQAGTAISQHGVATINTSLQSGSVAIVKIGDRGVKVVLK